MQLHSILIDRRHAAVSQSVSHETKQKVKRRMDLEMKITVARFIFIEKPLFLSSAPKKKRVSKRKWMSGEIDACGDVYNFT